MDDALPPLPPKLRPKPQRRDVGRGKRYNDAAAFEADLDEWKREKASRKEQVDERERARLKARDRSTRTRPAGDNDRRVRQKRPLTT